MTHAPSIKEALEQILDMPCSMVNDSDSLRHTIKTMQSIAKVALATFQPSGERREAIAQALLDRFIERGYARIQGSMFPRGTKINTLVHSYRDDFYADADAVILASGLVQDEAGWRDISTAPKDGTGFLFYQPVIGGRRIIDAGYFDGHLFRAVDFYQTDDPVVEPTHWMPLPAAAIRSARDGGAS